MKGRIMGALGLMCMAALLAASHSHTATGKEIPQTPWPEVPAEYKGLKNPYSVNDGKIVATGKALYAKKCDVCHGPKGDGKGSGSPDIIPHPADFTQARFRGMPDDVWFYRVSEGIRHTEMPAWKALGDERIWKIITYERTFSR